MDNLENSNVPKLKKVMILGSSGQLATELRLLEKSNDLLNLSFYKRKDFDITSKEVINRVLTKNQFDVIINCAAYTNVEKAESDFLTAKKTNADSIKYLCRSIEKSNPSTIFIHISTDYIFDGNFSKPITEKATPKPISKYGESKLLGEEFLQQSNIPSIVIRVSWLYSVYGNNFMKTIFKLGKSKEVINVINDQIGSPTSANDLAHLILNIINSKKFTFYANKKEIFNYSNSGCCTWYEFACEIIRLSGSKCEVKPISSDEYPSKVKRPKYSVLDTAKLVVAFDLNIDSWETALQKSIRKLTTISNNPI
ncbi:dTDP-4-dehydrorhamnose reductase [Gammaproteobacteria bacterium]|nr:dTDP-4-dehydrorhamnose reductase [Gammaproteobacteria bacterium]